MKTYLLRIMLPVFAFAALAFTAKAQTSDQLNVNVPYEFVVGGKTLPAGTYHVSRVSDLSQGGLVLSSFENHTGALVVPSEWENPQPGKTALVFEEIDGQYFLTKIETADHVFTIRPSPAATQEAMRKSNPVSVTTTISKSN